MVLFKYQPLDLRQKEIRLLRIEEDEDEAAPIRIIIQNANFTEDLDYYTLSYAWGEETPTHDVLVRYEHQEEGVIAVRENLYDFLKAARHSDQWWASEWIWIDQICINQDYLEERCHQVAQMAAIYSKAFLTLVWPGALPPACREIENTHENGPSWRFGELYLTFEGMPDFEADGRHTTLLARLSGDTFPALLAKSYWHRLWIVQEVALAFDKVLIFLGTETYWLHVLTEVIWEILQQAKKGGHDVGTIGSIWRRLMSFKIVYLCIEHAGLPKLYFSWSLALSHTHGTSFTDPFDRIYAFMGLVDESVRFRPDYTLTVAEWLRTIFSREIVFWESRTTRYLWSSLDYLIRQLVRSSDLYDPHRAPCELEREEGHIYPYLSLIRVQNVCRILRYLGVREPSVIPVEPHQLEIDPPVFLEYLKNAQNLELRVREMNNRLYEEFLNAFLRLPSNATHRQIY